MEIVMGRLTTPPDFQDSQWPIESGVPAARKHGVLGDNVLIGVLDTGIDPHHDEFVGRSIEYQYISQDVPGNDDKTINRRALDTGTHGTHTCGIAAGNTVGIAPRARLYVASVINSANVSTSMDRVALGLEWILREFSRDKNKEYPGIVLMPLGFDQRDAAPMGERVFQSKLATIENRINELVRADILPIAAIGNTGPGTPQFPGAFGSTIGVGSVAFDRSLDPNSASGIGFDEAVHKPDVVGYGFDIRSGLCRNKHGESIYLPLDGTSQAAAYVAGIAALYLSEAPTLGVESLIRKLKDSALPLNESSERVGEGLVRFVQESSH